MTPTPHQLKAIDVYSGCGGLTTGLLDADFQIIAAIENDEAARTAYRLNYPGIRLFGDVTLLKASDLLTELDLNVEKLDLLAGCSPCQGFSRMRTKNRSKAADDPRNDLVLDFVRLVEGLVPRAILFENVPGLQLDWRFEEMIRRLESGSLGYHLSFGKLNFADFGVPQRRWRLVVLGSRLGPISLPQPRGPSRDVGSAIRHMPNPEESTDPIHSSLSVHGEEVMERIRNIPRDGGSRLDLGPDAQLPCHQKVDGFRDVYGRMSWAKPAPTITRYCINPSKGRYLHPQQDREITLREASLLQTFPPEYLFPLDDFGRGAVASMIGEALPPEFARQAGEHIVRHLLAASQGS